MMATMNVFQAGLAFLFAILVLVDADAVKGSVQLNSGVFNKVVNKYKAVLVKFDETYPYGDKQDAYKKVAEGTMSSNDILCAEIQVADYGEKENSDLASRFDVKKDDFPVYLLFLNGKTEQPVRYKGNGKDADEIQKFLMKESGLWLGLPSCIEGFDKLVTQYFKASADKRQEIIDKAEAEKEKLTEETEKLSADIYIKTMKKVLEKGDNFVNTEITRVEKLKDGKVSDKKKEQLSSRLNILTSFSMRLKDEL